MFLAARIQAKDDNECWAGVLNNGAGYDTLANNESFIKNL